MNSPTVYSPFTIIGASPSRDARPELSTVPSAGTIAGLSLDEKGSHPGRGLDGTLMVRSSNQSGTSIRPVKMAHVGIELEDGRVFNLSDVTADDFASNAQKLRCEKQSQFLVIETCIAPMDLGGHLEEISYPKVPRLLFSVRQHVLRIML